MNYNLNTTQSHLSLTNLPSNLSKTNTPSSRFLPLSIPIPLLASLPKHLCRIAPEQRRHTRSVRACQPGGASLLPRAGGEVAATTRSAHCGGGGVSSASSWEASCHNGPFYMRACVYGAGCCNWTPHCPSPIVSVCRCVLLSPWRWRFPFFSFRLDFCRRRSVNEYIWCIVGIF